MGKGFVRLSVVVGLLAALSGGSSRADVPAQGGVVGTETIVLVRHGEKTAEEYGQLSPVGFKRALALPGVLIGKYGKPDFLFAPNPSVQVHSKTTESSYSYVRPLATIEPTAIQLGMPVNTQFGFPDIKSLDAELAKPAYSKAVIFVAWEHKYLDDFAKAVVKEYGGDAVVPDWPGKDYDSIFVIKIQRGGAGAGKATVTFAVDHEGLDGKLGDGAGLAPGK